MDGRGTTDDVLSCHAGRLFCAVAGLRCRALIVLIFGKYPFCPARCKIGSRAQREERRRRGQRQRSNSRVSDPPSEILCPLIIVGPPLIPVPSARGSNVSHLPASLLTSRVKLSANVPRLIAWYGPCCPVADGVSPSRQGRLDEGERAGGWGGGGRSVTKKKRRDGPR